MDAYTDLLDKYRLDPEWKFLGRGQNGSVYGKDGVAVKITTDEVELEHAKEAENKKLSSLTPITNVEILIFAWYKDKSAIKKTSAPSIVGIARRKANFEESFRFKPIKRAAVIAVPDLDAPGNKAKTWKAPMNNAPIIVSSIKDFDEDENRYATSSSPAKTRFI